MTGTLAAAVLAGTAGLIVISPDPSMTTAVFQSVTDVPQFGIIAIGPNVQVTLKIPVQAQEKLYVATSTATQFTLFFEETTE